MAEHDPEFVTGLEMLVAQDGPTLGLGLVRFCRRGTEQVMQGFHESPQITQGWAQSQHLLKAILLLVRHVLGAFEHQEAGLDDRPPIRPFLLVQPRSAPLLRPPSLAFRWLRHRVVRHPERLHQVLVALLDEVVDAPLVVGVGPHAPDHFRVQLGPGGRHDPRHEPPVLEPLEERFDVCLPDRPLDQLVVQLDPSDGIGRLELAVPAVVHLVHVQLSAELLHRAVLERGDVDFQAQLPHPVEHRRLVQLREVEGVAGRLGGQGERHLEPPDERHNLLLGRTSVLHAALEVRIYDYVDRHVPMLARMAEKRLRGYKSIGYVAVEDEPVHAGARPAPSADADEPFEGDAVIEWDLEALRTLEWDE